MKKFFLIIGLLSLAGCNQATKDDSQLATDLRGEQDVIVAKIATQPVYRTELASYTQSRAQKELDTLNPEVQKSLFDEFMQLELLSQKAKKMGLQNNSEYRLQIHNLKKNLLAQALLKDYDEKNPVSDADIQAEYDKAKSEFEVPQIKARHILVATEKEALDIIAQLKKNTDFAELAKEKSTGPSGPNGGDLGWFSPTQMVKPFSDAVIAMKKGERSATPVKTQFGFHIILKEDEKIGEAPPLDNLRPRLEQQIKKDRLEAFIDEIRTELSTEELFNPQVATPTNPEVAEPTEKPAETK